MTLDHRWIAAHIPHQGSMCLLEQVLSWDPSQLTGRAISHRALDHPLRSHGRLGAVCAIEYAAQAVAVHGALLRPALSNPGGFGMLTSARAVQLSIARLDDIEHELLICVQRLHDDGRTALYSFVLRAAAIELAHGRLSLLIQADQGLLDARGPQPGQS